MINSCRTGHEETKTHRTKALAHFSYSPRQYFSHPRGSYAQVSSGWPATEQVISGFMAHLPDLSDMSSNQWDTVRRDRSSQGGDSEEIVGGRGPLRFELRGFFGVRLSRFALLCHIETESRPQAEHICISSWCFLRSSSRCLEKRKKDDRRRWRWRYGAQKNSIYISKGGAHRMLDTAISNSLD